MGRDMKKALLVIDMQNVCVGKNYANLFKYDNDNLIKNVNEVIDNYCPDYVFYILNIMEENFINQFAPFKAFEGSEQVKLVKNLIVVNDIRIKKYKGDAFTNPELNKMLKEKMVDEIEIVGVDGGGCVALTALGAVKFGYNVTMKTNAIGTTFVKNANKYNNKLKKLGVNFI